MVGEMSEDDSAQRRASRVEERCRGGVTNDTNDDDEIENETATASTPPYHSSSHHHPCSQPEILSHIVSFICFNQHGCNQNNANHNNLTDLLNCRTVSKSWRDAVRQMAVPPDMSLTVRSRKMARDGVPIIAKEVLPGLQSLVYELKSVEDDETLGSSREEHLGRREESLGGETTMRRPPAGLTDDLLSALIVATDADDDKHDDKTGPTTGSATRTRLCFPRLRHLVIAQSPSLTHRAFSHVLCRYQHLQTLNVRGNDSLAYTLTDVAQSFPNLQVLRATNNRQLTGRLSDLTTSANGGGIAQSLQILELSGCSGVCGKLSDLQTSLPALRELGLDRTQVTGDLRCDIQRRNIDFPKLQVLALDPNNSIYGARLLHSVEDAPAVMRARHIVASQSEQGTGSGGGGGGVTCPVYPFLLQLDETSPDFYYGRLQQRLYSSERDPPTQVVGFFVGPAEDARYRRWGWRWTNLLGGECDVHWLDEAPLPPSEGESDKAKAAYETYLEEYEQAMDNASSLFHGWKQPPTYEEYRELCRTR